MISTVVILLLVLALIGALPTWSHSSQWGVAPSGGIGIVLAAVLIALLLGGF